MIDPVCLRTSDLADPASLKSYESIGGYEVWRRILSDHTPPDEIIAQIKDSVLRGRGGAGFPTGLKWSFIPRSKPGQKYVLCNADESEPGTCKDREILLLNPHQVFEGMLIASYCIGATLSYCFFRGEFWRPFQIAEHALHEARAAGYIGKNILGSGVDVEIHNTKSAGAYICGDETALMSALEGKKGWPRFKPPFPANYGLYGQPTNINNVETLASVPVILEKSSQWFKNLGTDKSGGTKIFSVTGHVNKPGNYEVPLGIPFADLLALAGGVLDGKKLKAVIPGGSSMPVLPADIMLKTNMDFESIMQAGSMLGSGAVIVMDESTCMVSVCARIAKFYMHESCGQCTPCREGTGWMYRLLMKILSGHGGMEDISKLHAITKKIEGHTICAFGEAAAWPVQGFLKHFYSEFEYCIHHKKTMLDAMI